MGDIDVLVAEDDAPVVLAALSDGGFERVSVGHHRPRTQTALNETIFELPVGRGAFVVEVHTALDKVFPRSIPYADVMIRSSEATARLRVPSREDHLLMVALHAAVADFDHPVGWLDLHLLLAGPLDFELIAQRANDWELSTALYVALHGLRRAGSDRVPPQLLEAVRPGILRRAWLRRYFDHRHFPMHAGDRAMGLSWAWRQTALRDDTWRWLIGCGRYGGLRVLERASRAMKSASAAMPSNRRG